MDHIIKRQGKRQKFDERKIYASCYAACLAAQVDHKKTEKICKKTCVDIKRWIRPKKQVTSDDVFNQMEKCIRKQHKHAAFMYKTHRDIS